MFRLAVFLVLSNVAMTFAWFLHLKFPDWSTWQAILISWGIAGLEYAIAVPAIRYASKFDGISSSTVKILQEAVTLSVFAAVTVLVLNGTLSWRFSVSALLVFAAVTVMVI